MCKILGNDRIEDENFKYSVAIDSKHDLVMQKNGDSIAATFKDLKYIPGMWINFFSCSTVLSHGVKVPSEQKCCS